MALTRPCRRARVPASIMVLMVAASSRSTRTCPATGALPPGRYRAVDAGQRAIFSALRANIAALNVDTGKPFFAHSYAGAATSAQLRVPQRASAVHHASGVAGTTVRSRPTGISPPQRERKNSDEASRGYGPTPVTSYVF